MPQNAKTGTWRILWTCNAIMQKLNTALARATRAEWHTDVECDACEGMKYTSRPIAPLPAGKLFIGTHYGADEQGELMPYIKVPPMYTTGIVGMVCLR